MLAVSMQTDNKMAAAGDASAQAAIPMSSPYPHWQMVFNKYDHDGDGLIPLIDFKQYIKNHTVDDDIPKHCIRRILLKADTNRDGFLSYPEFEKMVEQPEIHNFLFRGMQSYVQCIVPHRPRRPVQTRAGTDIVDYGEYEEEYSCWPPPICMIIISIVEIVLFLYDFIATGQPSSIYGPVSIKLIYNPHKRYEAWRFISYIFVHVGALHLVVNLAVQLMLGIPLEMVHRWWRVLIIYLAGAVAGSLATSVTDPTVYLAGASGGVYAVMTAHLATIIMNWKQMQFAFYQLIAFLVVVVPDIGNAIYNRYIKDNHGNQVGYVAHLAGALAGLLVGINILRNLEVKTWERAVWYTSLFLFAILIGTAIVWNIAFPRYFPVAW